MPTSDTIIDSNRITPAQRSDKHLAFVVHSTKLLPSEPGLDRGAYIAGMLAEAGYHVDVITSSFQHWDKSHRDTKDPVFRSLPFDVVFLDEPGYKRNIDPVRIMSHRVFNKNLRRYLSEHREHYDAVWAQIPPNNISATAAAFSLYEDIPFIVDVNDLWPEAMRMVLDVPVLSDIAFAPMSRDAKRTFDCAWGVVGTSKEYAFHGQDYAPIPGGRCLTVYVGNDLPRFDAGAKCNPVYKPEEEMWIAYAGTLGKSYDIETLIDAIPRMTGVDGKKTKVKILGDGPDRELLEAHAEQVAPESVDFLGYMDYEKMAGYLCASDIVVNSLVENAPQSIVSKIGDYLASGNPMVNTGTSPEMVSLVDQEGVGVSVEPGNAKALAAALQSLLSDDGARAEMGQRARALAEEKFDRNVSYDKITEFVDRAVFG